MKIHRRDSSGSLRISDAAPLTKPAGEPPAKTHPQELEAPSPHSNVKRPDGQLPASRVRIAVKREGTVFDGWLKVHRFTVKITRGGITQEQRLSLLQRPGHDSTHTATVKLHGDGAPTIVYKDGDTRPAAALRGTPYVATGIVAGSLDHEGVDAETNALAEIAEEVGGVPLGKLMRLGASMPTMPVTDGDGDLASSESDDYFLGVLGDETTEIQGDGGGLEVIGLMKPIELSISEALTRLDTGGVRENARARVALQRGLDKLGFVPQMNAWVKDLPEALRARFSNLGLGDTYAPPDATQAAPPAPHDEAPAASSVPAGENLNLASQVSAVDLGAPRLIALGGDATMLDGETRHLADDGTGKLVHVGRPTRIQTLHTEHDRLKLAQYYVDPKLGPMVRLDLVERPILAAKASMTGESEQAVRYDVGDLRVPLPKVTVKDGQVLGADELDGDARAHALKIAEAATPGAKVSVLSAPSYASPGQSDLRYHFLAAEVPAPRGGGSGAFVPLGEALARMRQGGTGDANTEALLLRLADHLAWVPQLGLTVAQAKAALGAR